MCPVCCMGRVDLCTLVWLCRLSLHIHNHHLLVRRIVLVLISCLCMPRILCVSHHLCMHTRNNNTSIFCLIVLPGHILLNWVRTCMTAHWILHRNWAPRILGLDLIQGFFWHMLYTAPKISELIVCFLQFSSVA